MTDDEFFAKIFGKPARPSSPYGVRKSVSARGVMTAAAVRGDLLAIATVEAGAHGLRVSSRKCGFFTIEGRDQRELKDFARDVSRSLSAWGVRHLVLRASLGTGPQTARPNTYKFETVLQMVARLDVDLVLSSTISNWINRADIELPEPTGSNRQHEACQFSAIQTAAYGLRLDVQ